MAAIALACLPAGCLTARATEPEKPRYCDDARKTELRKAAASPTAVFLQLETRSPDRKIDGRRVMRIPLDDSPGSPGRTASPRVGSMASGSGADPTDAVVRDVSGWFLPPGSLIPPDADPLRIFTLVSKRAAGPGSVQVLSMSRVLAHGGDGADSGTISAKSLALADPVIAILLKRDARSTMALIVADIHEGCEHEKGWYALMPLAVTGETDLLAPLAGHLLLSGLWRE